MLRIDHYALDFCNNQKKKKERKEKKKKWKKKTQQPSVAGFLTLCLNCV